MARKRQKTNSFQKQKIVKAQCRNEFIHNLKHFIDIIHGEEVSPLIPSSILNELYDKRIHPFRIAIATGSIVPSAVLKDVRESLSTHSKNAPITLTISDKLEVTMEEFFTLILTISLNLEKSIKENHPSLQPLKRNLIKFNATVQDLLNIVGENLHSMLLSMGFFYHDISKTIYWLKHELIATQSGLDNLIRINSFKIEKSNIIIDDIKRTIIRLGFAFPSYGIDWLSMKPSELRIQDCESDNPLDVFIQTHALQRLSERIDCFPIGSVHYNMFQSFKFPKVFYDPYGNILIEFRFFHTKAGYFRIDVIDGKIIIRTFLFVTNNGTPEGQMLANYTGLQKLDKKYLAIDKLSTFMTSDIGKDENVKKLFIDSGCQCLLYLFERFKSISNTSKRFDSQFMLKYCNSEKMLIP